MEFPAPCEGIRAAEAGLWTIGKSIVEAGGFGDDPSPFITHMLWKIPEDRQERMERERRRKVVSC